MKVVPKFKIRSDILPDELIRNHAIVNAPDFHAVKVQLASALFELTNIGDANPEKLLRQNEIGCRFLLVRIDLEQRNVLGRVPVEYGALQKSRIRRFIEPVQITRQLRV